MLKNSIQQTDARTQEKPQGIQWKKLFEESPVVYLTLYLYKGPGSGLYSRSARDITMVIAAHLNEDREAWPSKKTIAEKVGLKERQVQRIGNREVWDGPHALFNRTYKERYGKSIPHYTPVRQPEANVAARDLVRDKKQRRARAMLRLPNDTAPLSLADDERAEAVRREKIELQKLLCLERITQADYDRRVAELERPILATVGGKHPPAEAPKVRGARGVMGDSQRLPGRPGKSAK